MAQSTSVRWAVRNGLWTFGAPGFDELVKLLVPYTLAGIADRITCPTLSGTNGGRTGMGGTWTDEELRRISGTPDIQGRLLASGGARLSR